MKKNKERKKISEKKIEEDEMKNEKYEEKEDR